MSTELDEAKLWYATAPDFDSYPEMLDAFHKHMLALASLPQQDAGEDRYTGEWENGFFVCRDMSKPEGSRIFYMSPESEAVWIERLNAAFAAGRSVPSPVGQAATVEQVLEEIQRWTWDHFKIQNKAMFENMRERLDPLFTHPPKAVVLTDENIKTIVAITFPNDTQTESIRGMEDGFAKGLRYARDNGYLNSVS